MPSLKKKTPIGFDYKAKTQAKPRAQEAIQFRPLVLSRHPSHAPLRKSLSRLPFRSVVRLGSTTPKDDDVTHGGKRIECNTVAAVKISSNKRLMKMAFIDAGVVTPEMWYDLNGNTILPYQPDNHAEGMVDVQNLPYPIVAKHIHGSRGTGNYLLNSAAELNTWRQGKTLNNYIFEKFYTYTREYRLHVTKEGCFYTCRKMLKRDAPKDNAWQRHDDNCVWIVENNPAFDKPTSWNAIVEDCVKALNAIGLDIGAFDVKVQSARNDKGAVRQAPRWIVIESASAPSFGEITLQKYREEIPKILRAKKAGK